jgi:hypothetical protein
MTSFSASADSLLAVPRCLIHTPAGWRGLTVERWPFDSILATPPGARAPMHARRERERRDVS